MFAKGSAPKRATVSMDQRELQREYAGEFLVASDIHPDDMVWQFILGHASFADEAAATHYYFNDGRNSAGELASLVRRHVPKDHPSLLEFAAGYGCVTRHLAQQFPGSRIVSCDIHPQAVEFIQDRLGGAGILSRTSPGEADFGETFDVVFALSFFSHMPRATWGSWLAALFDAVNPGGILAFTTHGMVSHEIFGKPTLSDDGFWFEPTSEQYDLDGAEYGSTVTSPEFVVGEVYRQLRAPIAEYKNGFWWKHQDLWIVAKQA
jgi:SAM-dependent methyltransferase